MRLEFIGQPDEFVWPIPRRTFVTLRLEIVHEPR